MQFMLFKRKPPKPEPFFPWLPTGYSVGIAGFDKDHRQAVRLLNQIHFVLIKDRDRAYAYQLMQQLFQLTRIHFAEEEAALKESGYPYFESHLAEHERLLAETADLLKQFTLHTISDLAFPNFVAQWLIGHITGPDQKYSRWLRSKQNP